MATLFHKNDLYLTRKYLPTNLVFFIFGHSIDLRATPLRNTHFWRYCQYHVNMIRISLVSFYHHQASSTHRLPFFYILKRIGNSHDKTSLVLSMKFADHIRMLTKKACFFIINPLNYFRLHPIRLRTLDQKSSL